MYGNQIELGIVPLMLQDLFQEIKRVKYKSIIIIEKKQNFYYKMFFY